MFHVLFRTMDVWLLICKIENHSVKLGIIRMFVDNKRTVSGDMNWSQIRKSNGLVVNVRFLKCLTEKKSNEDMETPIICTFDGDITCHCYKFNFMSLLKTWNRLVISIYSILCSGTQWIWKVLNCSKSYFYQRQSSI